MYLQLYLSTYLYILLSLFVPNVVGGICVLLIYFL